MLARLQVYLPFTLHLIPALQNRVVEKEIGGDIIRFHAPYRSSIERDDAHWLVKPWLIDQLNPMSPQRPQPGVLINGQPVIPCDALQLDFVRDSFDRSHDTSDPSIDLAFHLVNSWLNRLRILAVAPDITFLEYTQNVWRLQYLNDDETELEHDPELIRSRYGTPATIRILAVTESLWDAVAALPWGYEAPPSDLLLLDAFGLSEQVGPAVVLGFTALETRISRALDRLAQLYGVHPGLWAWVNSRSDIRTRPSTLEEFDSLLHSITRRTLKEDLRLWEGFHNIRKARNSFVHEGVARIGQDLVDWNTAMSLLRIAREIIDWVEALLPEVDRAPKFSQTLKVELTVPITPEGTSVIGPAPPGASVDER